MAIWTVRVIKSIPSQGVLQFGNTYHVSADDLDTASNAVLPIVDAERLVHTGSVNFLRAVVSDTDPVTDLFQVFPLSGAGTLTLSGDNLPAFVTMNVVFQLSGGGRPGRKYYHQCAGEGNQATGNWDSTILGTVDAAMEAMITSCSAAGCPLIDPEGQEFQSASPVSKVGFHQFHKSSRKALPPSP